MCPTLPPPRPRTKNAKRKTAAAIHQRECGRAPRGKIRRVRAAVTNLRNTVVKTASLLTRIWKQRAGKEKAVWKT
jgi:hypothetical protein